MSEMKQDMSWAYLIHLGYNMWCDWDSPEMKERPYLCAKPCLRCDKSLWDDLVNRWTDAGINVVVIDLGDGVRYDCCPEIAVEGAWSPERLSLELTRLRQKGIEPIPKMNFSTAHDAWLGRFSRCVSTEPYYAVCRQLIAEAIALFDRPRYFHLGMDEETAEHQRRYAYAVMRQHKLWWHDLGFLCEQVEKGGVRPWIWSDYLWRHPELFCEKMPNSVLQSNWYYGAEFNEGIEAVRAYLDLEGHGYDQVPTGSNWSCPENFERTVAYCADHISAARLKGFLQAPWKPTLESARDDHFAAVEQVARARAAWEKR